MWHSRNTLDWRDHLKLYGGPKLVFSWFSADPNLYELSELAADAAGVPHPVGSVDSTMQFFGGVAGLSAGYWRIHAFLELDAGYTRLRPTLLGRTRDLGGLTLFPAVGLAVSL